MIDSITLLGSSSGRNAGDAALLSSIMDEVDAASGERLLYEIPSLNPEFVWRTYKNRVRPLGIMPWHASAKLLGVPTYRSLMRTDMSLIFDATLFDRSLYNPFFNFMSSYDLLLPHARKRGKKMACYTVTVGPVSTPKGRDMMKRVLDMMDFITVRDQDAVDIMNDIGVQNENVLITNDTALCTRPASDARVQEIWKKLGLSSDKEVLALNVNPYFNSWTGLNQKNLTKEDFIRIYSRAVANAVKDVDADLLFVSTQHMDEVLTREIMARINTPHKKALFSNRDYDHHDIRGVMAKPSLLFAMRLHCLILTSAALTPIISLNYLPKVTTYLKSLGLQDYSLGFEHFDEEAICAHIQRGWADRNQLKALVQQKIPPMKREAQKAAELVAAMRRGESVDSALRRLRAEPVVEHLAHARQA